MPTARVRRPAPATIGADLRPVREIRVGDRLPVDPSAHRLRPSVVVDMPGDGPQWCALVTVTDVEHTDAPTVHLHVDRIAYPRSRTCPPCPPRCCCAPPSCPTPPTALAPTTPIAARCGGSGRRRGQHSRAGPARRRAGPIRDGWEAPSLRSDAFGVPTRPDEPTSAASSLRDPARPR